VTVTDRTRVLLTLEIRRDLGFVTARVMDLPMPTFEDQTSRNCTERDVLRAWLHHQMHRALAGGHMEPGLYRVLHAGERVLDLWTGKAMAGCTGRLPHVTDCGLYACPSRRW
jgi:hypothetical protein